MASFWVSSNNLEINIKPMQPISENRERDMLLTHCLRPTFKRQYNKINHRKLHIMSYAEKALDHHNEISLHTLYNG